MASPFFSSGGFSQTPAPPATVNEAIFRSRWEGLQADRQQPKSAAALAGLRPGDPNYSLVEGVADSLVSGLWLGPLEVHPGLSFGWEYSNQNYSNQNKSAAAATPSSASSFFVAPTLALKYDREIGPWSVSAAYAAGLRYYLNKNYTAAGTGNQRNPFSQTASLSVGHLGDRHNFTLRGTASTGSGFAAPTSQNQVQTNLGAAMDYRYTLATDVDVGAKASYSLSMNQNAQNGGTGWSSGSGNGNLGNFEGGVFADWLATGKTRLRWQVDAGQSSQALDNQQGAGIGFVQTLLSDEYTPTEKLRLKGGLGAGYLTDSGNRNRQSSQSSQYTGLRPRYELEASYIPTEKTSLSAKIESLGADIRPNVSFQAAWQPRVNTGLSMSVYQTQAFSLTTSNQTQISRGVIGTFSQRFFSKVALTLSAGWQQTQNLNLSNQTGQTGQARQTGTQNPYGFASATLAYNFTSWSSWQASWWSSGGSGSSTGTNSRGSPETRATLSFNLTF